ncbi:MAG: HAD family hydrolase [Thermoplasmata archaeon]
MLSAVLFVVEGVLVPDLTRERWQWAWRPQGPVISERTYHAAAKKAQHRWDRRRWAALLAGASREDAGSLRGYLRETLGEIAGHPLPEAEVEVIVERFLRCPLPRPPAPEVPGLLAELKRRGTRIGAIGRIPGPSGPEALLRAGIRSSVDVVVGSEAEDPSMPAREAFRAAAKALGVRPGALPFVGTLFWSEVRAAHRAGLEAFLLDREELGPKTESGRLLRLTELLTLPTTPPADPAPPPSTVP